MQKGPKIIFQLRKLAYDRQSGATLEQRENADGSYNYHSWPLKPVMLSRAKKKKIKTAALQVTSAYHTVSTGAILVITGTIPIDLQGMKLRNTFDE